MTKKRKKTASDTSASNPVQQRTSLPSHQRCGLLHLHMGWWSLLCFLSAGLALEGLLGFKAAWYVNVGEPKVRRMLWRLAHAHGTLLSLVHIAFALTVLRPCAWSEKSRTFASRCLISSGILLPGGFFLGGIVVYDGDPGLGIMLVPVGGILLFVAVLLTALGIRSPGTSADDGD